LVDIQARRNLALLFITHDLSVVEYLADRIAVMKAGHIVELADANTLLDHPQHPFSIELLAQSAHGISHIAGEGPP
jgi:ABC-type dipeptide/oligopeptide/nickel transport system ATPase component